jgi:hypothetical protein
VAATRHERGLVAGDEHTHVAVPHLNGPVAKCGAGKITQKVPGFFDPTDPTVCPTCRDGLDP